MELLRSRNPVSQAGSGALLPCIYTFSKDYDISDPYYPQVNESASLRLDSTFQPDPPEGWFGLGNSSSFDPPIIALDYFQTAPWFYLAIDPSATQSDIQNLGNRHKAQGLQNPLLLAASESLVNSSNTSDSTLLTTLKPAFENSIINLVSSASNDSGWSGLLGDIDTSLFMNISVNFTEYFNVIAPFHKVDDVSQYFTISNFSQIGVNLATIQPLPWFTESNSVQDDELDDQISNALVSTLHQLGTVNDTFGISLNFRGGSIFSFPAAAASVQVVSNMPWGNVRFSKVQNGSYAYMIQAGTDARLLESASYPSEGLRRMVFQTMLSKAARMSILRLRLF